VGHDPPQELALGLRLRLDHVPAIVAIEEELPALGIAVKSEANGVSSSFAPRYLTSSPSHSHLMNSMKL
jgi:hypothetical protein